MFDALWAAGQPHGLKPFGMFALDSLRVEKGYRAWKGDLSTDYTLFQGGLDRFVKLDKARNRLLNVREKLFGVEQTLSDQGIVAANASGRVGDISTTNLDWTKRNDGFGMVSAFLAPFLGLLGVGGVGAGAIVAVRRASKRRAATATGRPTVHIAGLPRSWQKTA